MTSRSRAAGPATVEMAPPAPSCGQWRHRWFWRYEQPGPGGCLKRFRPAVAALMLTAGWLGGCSVAPPGPTPAFQTSHTRPLAISETGNEVMFYAMDLLDTGYRFGGKNPQAGLDCSGMVSYIYKRAAGITVTGSAADIARRGHEIDPQSLRPGDLVFFNTQNKPFSHVGIYIGDNRFVHAPSTNGKVRIDRLDNHYYAQRFEMARSYFD